MPAGAGGEVNWLVTAITVGKLVKNKLVAMIDKLSTPIIQYRENHKTHEPENTAG